MKAHLGKTMLKQIRDEAEVGKLLGEQLIKN